MRSRIRTKLAASCLAVAATATLATTATPAAAATPADVLPSPTTTTQYCRVSFTLLNQWPGGYEVGIVITNISSVPVRWRLTIRSSGPILLAQVWNGTAAQSGSTVTIVPNPPFDVLNPGQSAMIGELILSGGTVVLPIGDVTCTPV
jgi:cellulase/cellobiase CelA1